MLLVDGADLKTAMLHRMCKIDNVTNGKIFPISDIVEYISGHSVISLSDAVYSIVGYTDESLGTAKRYDLANKKLTRIVYIYK